MALMEQGELAGVAARRHLTQSVARRVLLAVMEQPGRMAVMAEPVALPSRCYFRARLKTRDRLSVAWAALGARAVSLVFPDLAVPAVVAVAGLALRPMAARAGMAPQVEQARLTLALQVEAVQAMAAIAAQRGAQYQAAIQVQMEPLEIIRYMVTKRPADLVAHPAFSKPMVRKAHPARAATPSLDQLTQKS
jgi:hypothetical protein